MLFVSFDHLAVCITVIISAVVVYQPLSKFGMFTFVVLYTMPFTVFFSLNGEANKIFGFLWENTKLGGNFQRGEGRTTLE